MKVIDIEVERLVPNRWNVNRVSSAMMAKLKRYIKREGMVQPLVVRAHHERDNMYELIGGEHRHRVCSELGFKTVPCIVVDLDDRRAKVLSVNLNSMSGETVPSLLSQLLTDLQKEMPIDDMAALLPYDTRDITDTLQLMQLPEGFANDLEKEAGDHDRQAPEIVTLVFDPTQRAVFDEAMEKAAEAVGPAKDRKARAAVLLAESYLGQKVGKGGLGGKTGEANGGRNPDAKEGSI